MYKQAVVHPPTSNWTFQLYLFMYFVAFWSRLKLPLATEWVSDVKETPVQTQFVMPGYTLHHWLHNIYVLSFLFFFISLHVYLQFYCHYLSILLLLNICCIFLKQSISLLVLSAVFFSLLQQQANFLTGIIKVRSYLIKLLFICCGKCKSFSGPRSRAAKHPQKLAAGFHWACCLQMILSCPLVPVKHE